MTRAYIGIGSNLGNRERYIATAVELLRKAGNVVAVSKLFETAAWNMHDAPDFLNGAIALDTHLSAHALMVLCHDVEQRLGRRRNAGAGYASRTADLDLLFYGNQISTDEHLTLPHPGIENRRFVLEPLKLLAPELVHPRLGLTVTEMLALCPDQTDVRLWPSPTVTLA